MVSFSKPFMEFIADFFRSEHTDLFLNSYLLFVGISGVTLLLCVNILRFLQGKHFKIAGFEFSKLHYYIMMSPFLGALILQSILSQSSEQLIIFILFAVAGVIGETLFSLIWHALYEKGFWKYKVQTLFNNYTSLLNFIPWGVGGLLYLQVIRILNIPLPDDFFASDFGHPLMLWGILFTATLLITFIIRYLQKNRSRDDDSHKYTTVTIRNYLVFGAPFLLSTLTLGIVVDLRFVLIGVIFGIYAFVSEYLFGKMCVFFVSKKLWTYTYKTFDNNHATLLALIPFGMAGFYFWTVYEVFTTVTHGVTIKEQFIFAYLIGALLFVPMWLFIYIRRKDLRGQILLMSVLVGLTGLTEPLFYGKYWTPNYAFKIPHILLGLEDLLLMFFIGGLTAVSYEFFRSKITVAKEIYTHRERIYQVIIGVLFTFLVFILFETLTDLNIIYTAMFGLYTFWLIQMFFRRDLFVPSILNALLFLVVGIPVGVVFTKLFPDIVTQWWHLEHLSGIMLFGLPIEELFWHFILGLAAGPIYELRFGLYYKDNM